MSPFFFLLSTPPPIWMDAYDEHSLPRCRFTTYRSCYYRINWNTMDEILIGGLAETWTWCFPRHIRVFCYTLCSEYVFPVPYVHILSVATTSRITKFFDTLQGYIFGEIKALWSDGLLEYISDLWNIVDFISNSFYVMWMSLRFTSWYIVNVSIVIKSHSQFSILNQISFREMQVEDWILGIREKNGIRMIPCFSPRAPLLREWYSHFWNWFTYSPLIHI